MTILDETKFKEFEEVVKPIMKWLAENMHPHAKIIIETDRAELVEGVVATVTDEFVPD